ncbi:MAG: glycoside hydrolase family 3 C-terminal domain-containing protein [Promethearchaeota archaeon]
MAEPEKNEEEIPDYKNTSLSFEERAADLVSRLTLEEKVSQMIHSAKAVSRLDIPEYNWWNECLHGVANAGVATVFPQAIGLGATFDPDLMFKITTAISDEARAKHHALVKYGDRGIFKGLTFWSPNINLFRDPRWGRGQETYGEDPYLMAEMGVSFVKGLQGDHEKYLKTVSTPKHYVVHSGPESKRHEFNAKVSEKELRETYLFAFKECIKRANAYSIMGAYNRTNGEVCCGSPTLLQKILRDELGFEGYVVSDCWAIRNFHKDHKITASAAESAALAVKNGCDLNCGQTYPALLEAVKLGLITEKQIDISVKRLLLARFKLGMFDSPDLVPYTKIPFEVVDCQKHRELALKAARESIVLLKNRNNFLPLSKDVKNIAVIGPNANTRNVLLGNYFGMPSRFVTPFQGICNKVPDARIYFAQGSDIISNSQRLIQDDYGITEAKVIAEQSDIIIMCLGLNQRLESEEKKINSPTDRTGDREKIELPPIQLKLLKEVYNIGKPIVLVLLNGGPVSIPWAEEHIPAIIEAWYPGEEGGTAIADVLFGDYSPSGRVPITFMKSTEDLPDFEDYSMKGRTYRFIKAKPLYPFGFGLSFTQFEYSNLELKNNEIKAGENLELSVEVKNIGDLASDEVVQLYLKDQKASVTVPQHQLTGIKRINLKPGEIQKVFFVITPRKMALINDEGKCVLEPGKFRVFVGGAQPDDRSKDLIKNRNMVLKDKFKVNGDILELEY